MGTAGARLGSGEVLRPLLHSQLRKEDASSFPPALLHTAEQPSMCQGKCPADSLVPDRENRNSP